MEVTKKALNITLQKAFNLILQLILFAVAAYLIVPNVKWQVSLGLFLFVWANNLMLRK
jgi:membrane protein implicated in regulation of membrane protease activity